MSEKGPASDRRFPSEKSFKRTFTHRKFATGFGPEETSGFRAAKGSFEPIAPKCCTVDEGPLSWIHKTASFTDTFLEPVKCDIDAA